MATSALPVPTILNILNDNTYYVDQNDETSTPRAKKRRLDHLSWEEKLQRKKLKNRVAAQTSRDRKKVKQEQMEDAIQKLFDKNENLLAECEKLREANERLQAENADLNQRLQYSKMRMSKPVWCVRARERINRIPPSTERNERLHSSGFGKRSQEDAVEYNSGLPSLPDLLDELESDSVDLNALEQLTQTLLEDIARDLESAAQKAADQESTSDGEDISRKVVGPPPKQLESSGNEMLKKEVSVEQDISEYLLLHHNYAKTHPKESVTKSYRKSPKPKSTRKLKTIRPKVVNTVKSKLAVKPSLPAQSENKTCLLETSLNNEVVFGTFDESTNTITILVNDDSSSIPLNEVIIDENNLASSEDNSVVDTNIPLVIDTSNYLTVPLASESNLSPRSDLGYESLDSPLSNSDLENWDQNVSELFPSLF